MPRIDAHLHVFTKVSPEFPRETTPVCPAEREEPAEKLLNEMEKHQIDSGSPCPNGWRELGTAPLPPAMPRGSPESVLRDWAYSTGDIRILPNTWHN